MITLSNVKVHNKGALIATMSVQDSELGMIIHDCALMESKGQRWVNGPQRSYKESTPEGEKTKYFRYIQWIDRKAETDWASKVRVAYEALSQPSRETQFDQLANEHSPSGVPF